VAKYEPAATSNLITKDMKPHEKSEKPFVSFVILRALRGEV